MTFTLRFIRIVLYTLYRHATWVVFNVLLKDLWICDCIWTWTIYMCDVIICTSMAALTEHGWYKCHQKRICTCIISLIRERTTKLTLKVLLMKSNVYKTFCLITPPPPPRIGGTWLCSFSITPEQPYFGKYNYTPFSGIGNHWVLQKYHLSRAFRG